MNDHAPALLDGRHRGEIALAEETHEQGPHAASAAPGLPPPSIDANDDGSPPPSEAAVAPPTPGFLLVPVPRAAGYVFTALVLALAQGFGQSVVSANLQQLQGSFGATQAETTWLTAAYLAPNASLSLALIKIRTQYGLRNFAELAILAFLGAAVLNYAADDLSSNLVVRFVSGCAAAPMTTLAFLYMLEPLHAQRKMTVGLSLALTLIFMGSPLTRLVSPHLLDVGLWHGLTALEVALAMVGLGCIYLFPLASPPRENVIHAADIVSFFLIAIGFGCATVALILGPVYWWLDAPWIGCLLVVAVAALAIAVVIELNRDHPLIDVRWLASPSVLHFTAALLLFRIVLSEQTSGAPGLFRAFGLANEQTRDLNAIILAATVAGGIACAIWMKQGRERIFHVVALLLIIIGALMDANATSQTAPRQLFLSQALLGFASALFMPPALLSGLMSALAKGRDYILSFVIVFLVTQKLGGTLGSAIFSSFVKVRQALHFERLGEAMRLTDPAVVERLALLGGAYRPAIADSAMLEANAVRVLSGQANLEATVLAYNDAFLVVAAISATALLALLTHIAIDWLRAHRAPPAAQPTA